MLLATINGGWQRAGLQLAQCCLLFIGFQRCEAQNLVPNGSFELKDTCPYTIGFQEGDRPLFWYSWLNSPDYFNACAGSLQSIDTLVGVPQNGWTFQYPWEGEAYVGMRTYDGGGDYREYVGSELIEPLEVGCTYQLRFRTNPAYGGNYWLIDGGTACNNIGLLFTTASNAWYSTTGPTFPWRNYAHLRTVIPIADTASWTLVEGTFVADSAYTHMVLGNFFPDSLTEAIPIGDPIPWTGITYYLIDGVEVIPLEKGCNGLGVEGHLPTGEPTIQWAWGTIQVRWEGEAYKAEIMDALGRIVEKVISKGEQLDVPKPGTAGVYYLRLVSREKQRVVKFEVW
ncbi:MAG: hypothetical protein LKM36_10185 [Flavobacteriales bacterium]|jgi:hypothetical protein|nr:hypothetical protein [Flavobacteriales bacterium]